MAKRLTKAEKAKIRRRKELSAQRDKRMPLTAIDRLACYFVELESALIRQGYDKDKARWVAQETIVDFWKEIIPRHNDNEEIFEPYEDDEDED